MKARLLLAALFVLLSCGVALSQPSDAASALSLLNNRTPCNQDTPRVRQFQPTTLGARLGAQDAYSIAFEYLVTFYPRWFTYLQSSAGPCNNLLGPVRISPLYHAVVAINDDTFYASAFIGVKKEPAIVTIPATPDNYSVLQLTLYGNIFAGIPSNKPGVYGLTSANWQGTLPDGVIRVPIPQDYDDYTVIIFRADKYVNGQDMRQEAEKFRRGLHAASLSDYLNDPNAGPAQILPEFVFAFPYKAAAVKLIQEQPIVFLASLQKALLAGTTPPMTQQEQVLSDTFNMLFQNPANYPQLIAGAQAAHDAIDHNYLTHTFMGTTWITFTDIGNWNADSQGYLNRSSITDYIQYGNNHSAAVYYHSFRDSNYNQLDGTSKSYTLTFLKGQQPDVSRFWSVTAYLPLGIELVPNDANKYVVASYTPGLVTGDDGSVTIYMSNSKPDNVPEANWLPVPKGPFNVMLRAYGPQGTVLNNTYVPPPVVAVP
jgi:hypothetical protein